MRIGLVLPSATRYSETFFSNKIKGLQANGFSVILFVNDNKEAVNDASVKIRVAPVLSGSLLKVITVSVYSLIRLSLFHFDNVKRFYHLEKADGIGFSKRIKHLIINEHILTEPLHWLHFGFGTMALGREHVAAAIGAKMAVSFRGFDVGIYPIKHPHCYDVLWRTVDKIHVISDDITNLLYQHGFKDQAPINKITPAIDGAFFKNCKPQKGSSKTCFVTIARLHWKKGLDYTLEALSLLKQSGHSFVYYIIGEGEAYESLKFATYQLNLSDEVIFLGRISHTEVRERLGEGDIYLQYSVQEGFCNSVLEAQAMGLLCVVSDAEGLSENVLDGDTGFVVPKRRPGLLASKIVEVLNLQEQEKSEMRNKAQAHVQKFNLEQQNDAFKSFYALN